MRKRTRPVSWPLHALNKCPDEGNHGNAFHEWLLHTPCTPKPQLLFNQPFRHFCRHCDSQQYSRFHAPRAFHHKEECTLMFHDCHWKATRSHNPKHTLLINPMGVYSWCMSLMSLSMDDWLRYFAERCRAETVTSTLRSARHVWELVYECSAFP